MRFHQTKKKGEGAVPDSKQSAYVLCSGQRLKKSTFAALPVRCMVVMVVSGLSQSQIWVNIFGFDSTKHDDDAVPLQAATSLFCVLGNKNVHCLRVWDPHIFDFLM